MFFGPHLLEADDRRWRQTWRVADEGRQHFLEVAGRDSLQVEDRDQHLKALRSPRISRQDRWRVSDALAIARCTVAHPRLANGDRADAGHDLAFRKMAMAYHALMARLGLEIRMLCEKLCNLRLNRLGQQRTRAAAQDLCQGVGEDPWLGELDDVTVEHGVSLLHWRSGGVEHHHDTPPYPVTLSPTSGHSSPRRHAEFFVWGDACVPPPLLIWRPPRPFDEKEQSAILDAASSEISWAAAEAMLIPGESTWFR